MEGWNDAWKFYCECETRALLRGLLRTSSAWPTPDRSKKALPGRWSRFGP